MARDEERLLRSHQEPIVGGLPDVPGILAAIRLRDGVGAATAMRAHVMAEAELAMETVQLAQQTTAAPDTQAERGRAMEG